MVSASITIPFCLILVQHSNLCFRGVVWRRTTHGPVLLVGCVKALPYYLPISNFAFFVFVFISVLLIGYFAWIVEKKENKNNRKTKKKFPNPLTALQDYTPLIAILLLFLLAVYVSRPSFFKCYLEPAQQGVLVGCFHFRRLVVHEITRSISHFFVFW